MKKTSILYAALLITQTCFMLSASAQKLPNKQTASIWAPGNIKIDGKADEWNNEYQAANTAMQMSYTLSNDDKNLYLTAYITDPEVIFYKAVVGGILFVIKNADHDISFRYPAFVKRPGFARLAKGEVFTGKDDDPVIVKDNTVFADNAKEIEVLGINGVDNPVSIYNNIDVSVAARFDAKQGYVYEIAVPLKYIDVTPAKPTFSYQLMLNGGNGVHVNRTTIGPGYHADGTPFTQEENDATKLRVQTALAAKYATTNLTGEYTLAKRP